MLSTYRNRAVILAGSIILWSIGAVAAEPPADTVYRNGYVYTVDDQNSTRQALAERDGKIIFVGTNQGADGFVGPDTTIVDLQGRMMMPGLVDGHMHPLSGGLELMSCSLEYAALTVEQFRTRIQACLDSTRDKEPCLLYTSPSPRDRS